MAACTPGSLLGMQSLGIRQWGPLTTMLQERSELGSELPWLPRVCREGDALPQTEWPVATAPGPPGGGHSGHIAKAVPAWRGNCLNAISQASALAQSAISGKAERGSGHPAGKGQSCTQAAPKGAQAARGHRPGRHHAAAGTGRALSGTCASTQPPILQVGDWQGQEKGREGRERVSALLAAPLGQEPLPSPRVPAHGAVPAHTDCTHTHRDTHTCNRPANTHTRARGLLHACTHRYKHTHGWS